MSPHTDSAAQGSMGTVPTVGYVDTDALFDSIERAVLRKLNGMDRGDLVACKARLARVVRERAELLDVAASIEHALRMGFTPEQILADEAVIRCGLQAAIGKAARGAP